MVSRNDYVILRAIDLKKYHPLKIGLLDSFFGKEMQRFVKAIDGINLSIEKGKIIGLAGESGCGKTTLGKTLLKAYEPTDGKIIFEDIDISNLRKKELKEFRRKAQMVFQDPYESLNPKFTIFKTLEDPLLIHFKYNKSERKEKVINTLELCGLKPGENFINLYPFNLSGGQRQRVDIARALILSPDFLVADEPVSMLDVSLRADILLLLKELNRKLHLTILYISHDLSFMRYICEEIAIMYLGHIVEMGTAEEILKNPLHPYTQALISAVLEPEVLGLGEEIKIKYEIASSINIPKGCRFWPRCYNALQICKEREPEEIKLEGRVIKCNLYV